MGSISLSNDTLNGSKQPMQNSYHQKKKKKRKRKKKKNGNENAAKEFNSNWYNDYSWLGYFVEEETTSCYG